ncbi:MAG: H/ACA ribonucleoprotein complex subunit GAR1 [Candidatus Hodarchaeota archaeon]
MKWLGLVMHVTSQGRLILQSDFTPPLNALVATEDKQNVGRVFDVFGPVRKPFVSIAPSIPSKDFGSLVGTALYIRSREKNTRRRSRGRKKF